MVKHPVKFRLFLLKNLPAAYFSGVRIISLSADKSEASVPFSWFTTNPFRSTYFACLSMAAEMSTGVLAMAHLHKRKPPVSMLITSTTAQFVKKATSKTIFLCEDGSKIEEAITRCIRSGEPEQVVATSTGRNLAGDTIAIFTFTWSFKIKVSQA